jgi:hypothetical protein
MLVGGWMLKLLYLLVRTIKNYGIMAWLIVGRIKVKMVRN